MASTDPAAAVNRAEPAAPLRFDDDDDRYLAELADYVAIPSISLDSEPTTMAAAARWLAERLDFADVRIVDTRGNPVVLARWAGAPGRPTVLVYGHYDVQPPGETSAWSSPPFLLTRYTSDTGEDRVRGRGATDDKGPSYIAIEVARQFIAQHGHLPLNLTFLFEGEEEIGSPHLAEFVTAHAAECAADLVISADGGMWRPTEQSLALGSKGLLGFDIEVTGANRDLHSGRYGGTVANPLHALASVLAGLHDADGRVAVPGFYDGIVEDGAQDRAELAAVDFDEAAYRTDLGVDELFGESGLSTLQRLWTRPTLEINGISGGGWYTVIPRRALAHITCRLVPGQDPAGVAEAVRRHLAEVTLPGIRVDVSFEPNAVPAYTISADHPAIRAARAALEQVYPTQQVVFARIGGTLPATALFEEVLGAKTLFFSFSIADELLHAPDEFLRVRRLREGMRAWERLFVLLADGRDGLTEPTRP